MALITGGIPGPVHSETTSVSLGSQRHEAITVGPRGREGLSALQCLLMYCLTGGGVHFM